VSASSVLLDYCVVRMASSARLVSSLCDEDVTKNYMRFNYGYVPCKHSNTLAAMDCVNHLRMEVAVCGVTFLMR
jgi:hypothetical protein